MYSFDQRPPTRFSDDAKLAMDQIRTAEYAVLVGRNNCGKSYILKSMAQAAGHNAAYLGPARYQNFNVLGYFTPDRARKQNRYNQFVQQWSQQQQNLDNSPLNLQQAIAELSDSRREALQEIIESLLGHEMKILHTVADNSMSQKYISIGGHNISYTSSGLRLITTLVTSLLDEEYDTFLIDEPELGISPEAQGTFADFLFDRARRAKYFSHVKTLVLATHSTVFLDRARISNNFIVSKEGDEISVRQVASQLDFNRIHFFLMGNRFETLYLPSLIFVVEGKSDYVFLQKLLAVRYPQHQFSVISANSDSRIKEVIHTAKLLLTDIQRSPYRDRIVAVLDSVHTPALQGALVSMGIPVENIVVWSKNGIEYFYPPSLLDEVFGLGGELVIAGDVVSRNGIEYPKAELAEKVSARLTDATPMCMELDVKLLALIADRLG
jgi:predicted ATP-dependent endonuclease of OLD family